MKLIGVIAEFNPFHNGHAYLIEAARQKISRASGEETGVIVCMSGNYVQRGSLAVFDKYTRAESALCSADILFEMPVLWATSDAGRFAACGVDMLSRLACDYIAFGIESSEAEINVVSEELLTASEILSDEPAEYKKHLMEHQSKGQAYPLARLNALKDYTGSEYRHLSTSNNILALEYLISIKKYRSSLKPVFIPRRGSSYDSREIISDFSSATAIREQLIAISRTHDITDNRNEEISPESTELPLIRSNMPEHAFSTVIKYIKSPVITDSDILPYIIGKVKTSGYSGLMDIYGMNEELLNRLTKLSLPTDYNSLKDYMKTRNLTMTRVCRLLLHTALGITEPEDGYPGTEYANLLAIRRSASKLLGKISDHTDLCIINKKAAYSPKNRHAEFSWTIDTRTTDIYNQIVYDKTGIVLPSELRSNIRFI